MAEEGLILRSPYLQWLLVQLFPKLRLWPVRKWPDVLSKVQEAEFDQFERIGIIAAVVISAWFLRPVVNADTAVPFAFLSQLVLSLPLLLILAGPFFLRRIRRCVDAEAKAKALHDGIANSSQKGS
ncbi:MAG: hypothetical protein Q8O37_15000 [Sulfuricellaceae bacterium]|nr:hypothetical protein [Sulfuricellaceae bacterium]